MKLITATDHVRLAVYDQNPQSDRTVFFIHGWPLSHEIFEYQTQLLLENGFRVASLDLRGFGCSDAPAFGYCYDQMAQDVHSAVKALGLQRFVLVGFSMGGAIALRYMRLFEGHGVSRLVLLAAAAPLWTERPDYPYGHPCTYAVSYTHLDVYKRQNLYRHLADCGQVSNLLLDAVGGRHIDSDLWKAGHQVAQL